MHGFSVCSFTFSLNLVDRFGTVCYFTGLDLEKRAVIVCGFTLPDVSERGFNNYSFLRLSVLEGLGGNKFSFF